MKIRIMQIVIMLVLSSLLCGCSAAQKEEEEPIVEEQVSIKESLIEALTGKVVVAGMMNADMRMDDGKCVEWITEEMMEVEIDGITCYSLDLRVTDDETVNGEMAGRLLASYAVSKDGMAFYQYNPADDVWEPLLRDGSKEGETEDSQSAAAGDAENAKDSESVGAEDIQNAEAENEQEVLYDISVYGTLQEDTREFTDEETGKILYYYTTEKFFFRDDFPNAGLISQTLQRIYDKYEESYIEGAEDYTCVEDEYLNTPYSLWCIICLEYVGDDYISILYNDVCYMGGAHPYSKFDGITIDAAAGESLSRCLNKQQLEKSDRK